MCPQPKEYIITRSEVQAYAEDWLNLALRIEYYGTKCSTPVLLKILLMAAARVVSVFAACRSLDDAPSDQTIRNALSAALPGDIRELERRLNLGLVTRVPRALYRKSRALAIDLTLIPYHGKPLRDITEIFRGEPKSGTSHFHAYATAVVLHKGYRYTVALLCVEYGVPMKDVVQRLLAIVRRRGIKVRYLLLDKGFYSAEVVQYLRRADCPFIIPVIVRGRKPKTGKIQPGSLRDLRRRKSGYYPFTLESKPTKKQKEEKGKKFIRVNITICVASKSWEDKETGKRRRNKQMFVVWKIRRTPWEIREIYRTRFGIETSFRQMYEAKIKTCTRDPIQRLLFVGIALILRNVWVWLHFRYFTKGKYSAEPEVALECLRFREMLYWIAYVIGIALGIDKSEGLDVLTYQRLMAKHR